MPRICQIYGLYLCLSYFALILTSISASPSARPTNNQPSQHLLKVLERDQINLTPPNNNENEAEETAAGALNSPRSPALPASEPVNVDERKDRENRCLVEVILNSRALSYDKLSGKKSKHIRETQETADNTERHASKGPRNGRVLTYLMLNQGNWLPLTYSYKQLGNLNVVEIVPGVSEKVGVPTETMNHFRPMIIYTSNGLKVWGAGSEAKFPPILEYIVQRIQSYYSVYKYEDLSRPSFDWTFKPMPKPISPIPIVAEGSLIAAPSSPINPIPVVADGSAIAADNSVPVIN